MGQKLTGKENDPCSTQMLSDALAMWGNGNSDFGTGIKTETSAFSVRQSIFDLWVTVFKVQLTGLAD